MKLNLFHISFFLCWLIACGPGPIPEINNLNENRIVILGHAGAGGGSNAGPSNSQASIFSAIDELKADGVEIDVQLSADQTLFLYHDESLASQTNCSGRLNSKTDTELGSCEYSKGFFNFSTSSHQLARLESILEKFSSYSPHPILSFDLKIFPKDETDFPGFRHEFAAAIISLVRKYEYQSDILIESKSLNMLRDLHTADPELKLFKYADDFETGKNEVLENALFGISIRSKSVSKEQIQAAHEAGIRMMLWSLWNREENRKAIAKSPDYIQSDRVEYVVKWLKK